MKKAILFVLLIFSLNNVINGQSMQFVYAGLDETSEGCTSMTECLNNQVCYFIEYTPGITGILTSYTMGFIGDCTPFGTPVLATSSCVMNNSSSVTDACEDFGKFLIQISGTGTHSVVENQPVNIGQVCFQLSNGYELELLKDDISGITSNVDSTNGQSYTEFIEYDTQTLNNDVCKCFQLTADSGSPTQEIECLSPIVPIKYMLNNCDTAIISNLAPGLTAELINGVINIEGAPTHGGAFTFVLQSPNYCECNPSVNQMEVDGSVVMIFSKCYTKVEDAISEYNNGETIDILGNLITNPSSLQALNNVQVKVHSGVKWSIKEE